MKIKLKHPSFTATLNDKNYNVRAKTAEKAAMKIYRINKSGYAELGYVELYDENNQRFLFSIQNWVSSFNSRKFKSKPKIQNK